MNQYSNAVSVSAGGYSGYAALGQPIGAGTAIESATGIRDQISNTESWLSELGNALDSLEKRLDVMLTPVPPVPPQPALNQAAPKSPEQIRSHVAGRLAILNEGFSHLAQRLNHLQTRIEL